jgi:hypothetical protein
MESNFQINSMLKDKIKKNQLEKAIQKNNQNQHGLTC